MFHWWSRQVLDAVETGDLVAPSLQGTPSALGSVERQPSPAVSAEAAVIHPFPFPLVPPSGLSAVGLACCFFLSAWPRPESKKRAFNAGQLREEC